ncbi:MAG: ABC transporter permease [Caldilineae bacterium]|nr:MAG: ABC transporter permease [Caldilineae bacterium]
MVLPKFRLEKTGAPFWFRTLTPVITLLITFILTSGLILWGKANPFQAYYYFLIDPLSNRVSFLEVLVKSTPLILTGIAVTVAFVSGYYNIGAEGQLYAGALAAAWLGTRLEAVPMPLAMLIMLAGGFLAGVLWALVPALLRVYFRVDEVVTTLLTNSIILFIVSAILNGPWRDPLSGWPQSPEIAESARLPQLVPRSRLHFGFVIAVLTVFIVWFVLTRTSFGLKLRAVGLGKEGARFAGIPVERTMLAAALISGGIAGIAGYVEVAGIQYHLISALSPGYGYTGIIIATMGGLNALAVGASALFFGLVDTGAQTVSRALGVPVYLGEVTQATMLLVILGMFLLQQYRIRRVR